MVALNVKLTPAPVQKLLEAIPDVEKVLEALAESLPGLQYGEITLYYHGGKFKRWKHTESKQID